MRAGLAPVGGGGNDEFDTAKDGAWPLATTAADLPGRFLGTVHLAGAAPAQLARIAAAAPVGLRQRRHRVRGRANFAGQPRSHSRSRAGASPTGPWPARGRNPGPARDRLLDTRDAQGARFGGPGQHPASRGFVFDVCGLRRPTPAPSAWTATSRPTMLAACSTRRWPTGRFAGPLPRAGRGLAGRVPLARTAVSRAARWPTPDAHHRETPDPVIVHLRPQPLHAPGRQGASAKATHEHTACIANAFADALRPVRDVADVRLPLTPTGCWPLQTEDPPPRHPGQGPGAAALRDGLSLAAQGSVDIAAPPARVFEVLLDPVALAGSFPAAMVAIRRFQPLPGRRDGGRGPDQRRATRPASLSDIDALRGPAAHAGGQLSLGTGAYDGPWCDWSPRRAAPAWHYDSAQVAARCMVARGESAARLIVAQF